MSYEEFWNKSKAAKYLNKFSTAEKVFIYDNKDGLSKVYNKFLTKEYKDYKIIFVHDDVIIEDLFLEEKLDKLFAEFDIVGLAGSKSCDITAKYPAWHLMAPRTDFVGEVAHSKDDEVWSSIFGPAKSRALVIDGLFIAVNVAKALEKGLKFDEQFNFHHYDIDFCLTANKKKIKIGVGPIRVVHFGLGDSMQTQEWVDSGELFKKKWIK